MSRAKDYELDGKLYHAFSLRAAKLMHQEYVRKVLRAAEDPPLVLVGARHTLLVYAFGGDWGYVFLTPTPDTCLMLKSGGTWGRKTRFEAETYARRHLAQLEENPTYLHPDDKDGQREYASWSAWQTRYREAKAKGMDDEAARDFANNQRAA